MAERIVVLGGLGLALCTIVALGCGGGSGGGPVGSITISCNFTDRCFDETVPSSLTSAQMTQLQNGCTGGAMFGNGSACPTASRVGTCALGNFFFGVPGFIMAPSANGVDERFYSPGYTALTAQQTCTAQGGTWTAG